MINSNGNAFRTQVFAQLEREDPRRWEELRGCVVTHAVFGEGTISKVMMADWSNPIHFTIKFGQREKTFHLSALGDAGKFTTRGLPEHLAAALAGAEAEIALEEERRLHDSQQKARDADQVAVRRGEQEAARVESIRQAAAALEASRQEQAERRLAETCDKVDQDQPLTAPEVALLLACRRHDLLQAYYERLCSHANDPRAIVKACGIWREAKYPEYAIRLTDLLLLTPERLSNISRAAVLTARGYAFLDLQQITEAKECALSAIEANPKNPEPHTLLGATFMAIGDVREAALHFATAKGLATGHGVARAEKAQQAEVQKQLQALEPTKRKALAHDLQRLDPQRYTWVGTFLR